MFLGKRIKTLREEQALLQRHLAAGLEIDTPMYSKIERGERRAKREQVLKLAELLNTDSEELLTLWVTDKIIESIKDDQYKTEALALALKMVNG